MMKSGRQNAIINIIQSQPVETQEELVRLLNEQGYAVTQATVSRDIKSLALTKVMTSEHTYCYALPGKSEPVQMSESFISILSDAIISIQSAYNQIVIKTVSASAPIATEIIDRFAWPEVLGTIAGENTILLIIRSVEEVSEVIARLNQLTGGKRPERG